MADQKLSELTNLTDTPSNTDELYIVNSGTSQAITYEQLQSGFKSIPKNAVMNGNFDIWQRGSSFAGISADTATADRWVGTPGDGATTVSRQAFTLGQTDVPGEPTFYLQFDQTTDTTSTVPTLDQRIEGVRTFAARDVVLSFWARLTSGSMVLTPVLVQDFGSSGSAEVPVNMTPTTATITSSWVKYTFTATLPSISGKTISGADDHLRLEFQFELAAGLFTFNISQVQLELGAVSTLFEKFTEADELRKCQRYFAKTFPISTTPAQNAGFTGSLRTTAANDGNIGERWQFPVPMRSTPTITTYNPGAADSNWGFEFGGTDQPSAVENTSDQSTFVSISSLIAGNANRDASIHVTADAEI